MNCRACGTPLPQGVAHCPNCGASTPYYYSSSEGAPDDPTIASSPETVAQLPPPPTTYGSPSYYNPYETYEARPPAPTPPSPQRPGKSIAVIASVVLLVLLLIGGGVFAWLEYSSAQNAAAANTVATATAHTNATATANSAKQHFTANGTFTILSKTNTSVRQDGQNKIYSYTQQEVDYGDVAGSYTVEETLIVHPDNTASFSGNSTCMCTVNGKSGTLMWSYTGTSTANGSYQGQDSDVHGTGDLANLHGQGVFQGQGNHGNYSSQLYFSA